MKKAILLFLLLIFISVTGNTAQTSKKTSTAKQQKQSAKKTSTKSTKNTKNTKTAGTQTDSRDTAKQKQSAETEQKKLRQQLTTLKKEIRQTEKAKGVAADDLARSEKAITETEQSLAVLGKQQTAAENQLSRLSTEQKQLLSAVSKQQAQLAAIVQQQYTSGGENRLKLLFSGDDPNRISRELQYMNYFSTAHTDLIHSLQNNLNTIRTKKEQTDRTKHNLEKIVSKTNQQKDLLEKEKTQHAILLSQLSEKLDTQKKKAERLEQDEKRLGSLITKLNRAIEEQKKEAARREAARKEAARKAAAQSTKKKSSKSTAESRYQDEKPVRQPYHADTKSAFGRMRGKLKMPVSGTVTAHYGMKRANGPSWKGIFIKAAAGTPIHAVAAGCVVFADSLRGFGNLVIIDHGDQYMTVYGNTKSLTKPVGSNVASGDTIATVGDSGENAETGLYFEIRHNGQAYNPLDWVR